MTNAYYNECDPFAAAWLRQLIKGGHIADGVVDERSIVDVQPEDLIGYTQIHLFAGIGGWSLALRLAGWPDDRPAWTGSCPCQPFSAAGRLGGTADERHLWPEMYRLVSQCRPAIVFGEQVASPAGLGWLDLVSADLEDAGYAIGSSDLCAAGVGAPHIRQRLYWGAVRLGNALGTGLEGHSRDGDDRDQPGRLDPQPHRPTATAGPACGVADTDRKPSQPTRDRTGSGDAGRCVATGRLDNAECDGRGACWIGDHARHVGQQPAADGGDGRGGLSGTAHGGWTDADWLRCRDGKWRSVEPGTQPLAHGLPARVGRLRAYGNAIVPQVAAEFIRAFAEASETLLRRRGLDGVSAVLTDLDDLLS